MQLIKQIFRREVEFNVAQAYCRQNGISYFTETSAKEDKNTIQIFKVATKFLYNGYLKFINDENKSKSSFVTLNGSKLVENDGDQLNDSCRITKDNKTDKPRYCCI